MVLLRPADYPTGKVVTSSPSQGWPTVSDRFPRTLGAIATKARPGDDANSPLGKDIFDWQ
jgi:hypothetical protein